MAKAKKKATKTAKKATKRVKRPAYTVGQVSLILKLAGKVSAAQIAKRVSKIGPKRTEQSLRNFASSNEMSLRLKPKKSKSKS